MTTSRARPCACSMTGIWAEASFALVAAPGDHRNHPGSIRLGRLGQGALAERLLEGVEADFDDAPVEPVDLPFRDADVAAIPAFELPHEDVLAAAAVLTPLGEVHRAPQHV